MVITINTIKIINMIMIIIVITRYDTVDRIRLPTRLYLEQDHYDNAVVKVEAMEEFEDKQNMAISEVMEESRYNNQYVCLCVRTFLT